jgi:quercetin dioxygenase-like cupin family protein
MAKSFVNPSPVEIGDDDPVATEHAGGTPDGIAPGYLLKQGEGPAIWFMGGLITMKARKRDTDGQFALTEWYGPRGFLAPGHLHHNDAEAFYVLEGTLDVGIGDAIHHATPGDFFYVPKMTVHDWVVTSSQAKFLVLILPGGFEHFFEELADPALANTIPYTEHRNPEFEEIAGVAQKYGWSPAEGKLGTVSSAPPPVGRLERD